MLTDPPYGIDYTDVRGRKIRNDKQKDKTFVSFLTQAFVAAAPTLRPGAAFYVWHAEMTKPAFVQALKAADLEPRQVLVWAKSAFVLGHQDYQWQHEPCLYGWKGGAAHHFVPERSHSTVLDDLPALSRMSKPELLSFAKELLDSPIPQDIIREDKPHVSDLHPTMKPVGLLWKLVRNSTKPGDNVLDPFLGSGSTLICCEQTGRSCFGLELDPHYCDVVIARWEALTGGKAKRAA
jgi:site-specific DNA-methyltransferase (adenine-specific)